MRLDNIPLAVTVAAGALTALGATVAMATCTPTAAASTSALSCLMYNPSHICTGTGPVTGQTYWWCCPDGCPCGPIQQNPHYDAAGNLWFVENFVYCG